MFYGRDTRVARRSCPANLVRIVGRKLDQLDSADLLRDLRVPPVRMTWRSSTTTTETALKRWARRESA